MNVELVRHPSIRDYEFVSLTAQKECECTEEMKVNLEHGDETVCKSCAARQVLNGLTSLADRL